MAIKIYNEGKKISRGFSPKEKPVRLVFKQYYLRGDDFSWYSIGRDSEKSMLAMIADKRRSEIVRHEYGVMKKIKVNSIEHKLLEVKEHMALEAAEKAVKFSNPVTAFTVSLEGYSENKEYLVSSLNQKILLDILYETCPHLKPAQGLEDGAP
ncbi:hypothetical protein P5704_025510 (plasmid) [Pseudomonas sp. FeN3W]|nr:hypothetical protein P5704_025510 [Pseudomonas sp. FeN3W]